MAIAPSHPVFSESFSVSTVELDDTTNTTSVRQVLHRDYNAHRSWMSANGTLVGGAEEQVMRCDIHPKGWFVSAGGQDTRNLSSWSCTNMTIDSDPQHCQWNDFWVPLPENATYVGQEEVDGRTSNRWDYWMMGEKWATWASLDGRSPVATGKVWTGHPGFSLWRILWRDFKAGPPPLASFDVTAGIKCGPVPPPPPPFTPATDCTPACAAGALCCQDPASPPPGACFGTTNCSNLPGLGAAAAAAMPASLSALLAEAKERRGELA
jgi:hypothetical protein